MSGIDYRTFWHCQSGEMTLQTVYGGEVMPCRRAGSGLASTVKCLEPKTGQKKVNSITKTIDFAHLGILFIYEVKYIYIDRTRDQSWAWTHATTFATIKLSSVTSTLNNVSKLHFDYERIQIFYCVTWSLLVKDLKKLSKAQQLCFWLNILACTNHFSDQDLELCT